MKLTTMTILAMLVSAAAMAQTFTVSPGNKYGFVVQGSDDSVYHYSIAPNGSYTVQKDGEGGTYQASPPWGGGYTIQGVDNPKWALPTIIPPAPQP